MFPNPLDPFVPAATVDCLAATGLDSTLPIVLGLAILAFGVVFFVLSRARLRKSGVTLGLLLLLAGATGAVALAPVTSASADSCTPLDYELGAYITPDTSAGDVIFDSGDTASIAFSVQDVVDRAGTPPLEVIIPKLSALSNPSLVLGDPQWTFDDSDPAFYHFIYTGPLDPGVPTDFVVLAVQISNGSSSEITVDIPVTIVTGSAGDTVVANNSVTVSIDVQGIVP